jgi:hypothetical protein
MPQSCDSYGNVFTSSGACGEVLIEIALTCPTRGRRFWWQAGSRSSTERVPRYPARGGMASAALACGRGGHLGAVRCNGAMRRKTSQQASCSAYLVCRVATFAPRRGSRERAAAAQIEGCIRTRCTGGNGPGNASSARASSSASCARTNRSPATMIAKPTSTSAMLSGPVTCVTALPKR